MEQYEQIQETPRRLSPLPGPNHMLLVQLLRMKRTRTGQAILDAKVRELYERGILKEGGIYGKQTHEDRALCS